MTLNASWRIRQDWRARQQLVAHCYFDVLWHIYVNRSSVYESVGWPPAACRCESVRPQRCRESKSWCMKWLRQVLDVSLTAKKTYKWVLGTADVDRSLFWSIRQRRMTYVGRGLRQHIWRKKLFVAQFQTEEHLASAHLFHKFFLPYTASTSSMGQFYGLVNCFPDFWNSLTVVH